MREALAVLLPACAVAVFLLPDRLRWRSSLAAAAIALGLGLGFSSLLSTALIAGGIAATSIGFVAIDAALWVSVAAVGWWLRLRKPVTTLPSLAGAQARGETSLDLGDRVPVRQAKAGDLHRPSANDPRTDLTDRLLRFAFGTAAIVAFISVMTSSAALPHGDWDAWAIWNQHARFLFRGGGSDEWRALFSIRWSQPDYPLLLPASVARVWAYAGHESTFGPAFIAMVFGMASVVLVVTTLRGRVAWIAGTLILAASAFLTQVASQCADVPLAFFILAALAVACGDGLHWQGHRTGALVAGALSGMAAWTKNEGLVFVLLMAIVAVAVTVRPSRPGHDSDTRVRLRPFAPWRGRAVEQAWWGMVGALPVVIALAWFKLSLAPSSGLVEGQSLSVIASRLLDPGRHAAVAVLMVQHAIRWSGPVAIAIFPLSGLAAIGVAIRGGGVVRTMTIVLGMMLLSYYLVYVMSPFDVTWHVSTSVDRLLVHLWPSLVLIVGIGLTGHVSRLS